MLSSVSVPAAAQGCPVCDAVDSTHSASHTQISPALGVRVGVPQKLSAAVGILAGKEWREEGKERARFLAVFAEPGLAGGRVSAGYVTGMGELGSGYGIFGTVLRTFDGPWTLTESSTFVGGEIVVWPLFFAGPRIGLFRRVKGGLGMGSWHVVADFGLGL
jgi:hypothetical protein